MTIHVVLTGSDRLEGAWFESGGSDVSAAEGKFGAKIRILMGGIRAERRAAAEIYFFENGALKENIY